MGHRTKFGLMSCQSRPTCINIPVGNFKICAEQVLTKLDADRTAPSGHQIAPTQRQKGILRFISSKQRERIAKSSQHNEI